MWLADDSTRIMLMLKSGLSFGSLNLYLTSFYAWSPLTVTHAVRS